MEWLILLLAGLAECGGVIFLKLSNGFTRLKYTIITILFGALSFYLLSLAMQEIATGTAYAIWTGIGSAGSVLLGMIFFKEPRDWKRMLFLSFIITGTIGLRVIVPH